ncbi:TPA: Eco57I restriction-modification methylase domain-containing protein [Staphylococcus aureus]|nr:Eco57I restriction-modification methylase domain-containing protein [Staphylococcus aureus]
MENDYMRILKNEKISLINRIEKEYSQQVSKEYRNINGQFFTPETIGQEIADFTLNHFSKETIKFIEPALGLGSFVYYVKNSKNYIKNENDKFIGIEKYSDVYVLSKNIWDENEIEIINNSFEDVQSRNHKYNLLITNPPYTRHHHIAGDKKDELQNKVLKETGYKVSGNSSLYIYFILLAHKLLEEYSVSTWLIPVEFLFTKYGKVLRDYLSNDVTLINIHKYNIDDSKFIDANVSSCVVTFIKVKPNKNNIVNLSQGPSIWDKERNKSVENKVLQNSERWSDLFFDNLEIANTVTVGDFFYTKRGIATGDNKFFIHSKEEITDMELSNELYKPLIPASRNLKSDIVYSDVNGNPRLDNPLFLIDTDLSQEELKNKAPKLYKKITEAEELGINQKYLLKKRKVWYKLEKRDPAPFIITYMARKKVDNANPFRIIWNKSNGIVTNNYIMLYPKGELEVLLKEKPELYENIFNILKDIEFSDFLYNGREYGGGLKKIEPKEILKLPITGISELLLKYT